MASASKCDLQIPRALLDAVNATRPQCQFYKEGRCKKGGRCPYFHAPGQGNSFLLPRISRHSTVDGEPYIQIRPPAKAMIQAFFKEKHMDCPVGPCRRVKNTPLLEFQFVEGRMQQPKHHQCQRAHLAGKVCVDIREFCGKKKKNWCKS